MMWLLYLHLQQFSTQSPLRAPMDMNPVECETVVSEC